MHGCKLHAWSEFCSMQIRRSNRHTEQWASITPHTSRPGSGPRHDMTYAHSNSHVKLHGFITNPTLPYPNPRWEWLEPHMAAGCAWGNEPRCSWRPFLLPGSVLSHTAAPRRALTPDLCGALTACRALCLARQPGAVLRSAHNAECLQAMHVMVDMHGHVFS